MEVTHAQCAGIDVHKKNVVVCRIIPQAAGWQREVRTFSTMTKGLLELSDWLKAGNVTIVAMESTGVYWRPIFNILEGLFEVILVNAEHIKHVPGRKTDVKDAQWIAELLQHGLLKASYIPPEPQRDLRMLLRYRVQLVQERTQEINRVQKVLEDANIKLGDVVSNIMGVSAQAMLQAIIGGQSDPSVLAQLAHGKLRPKITELEQALQGHVKEVHRLLLRLHLEHIDDLNAKIETLSQEVERLLGSFDPTQVLERLQTIPGVGIRTAQMLVAEIGLDMSRFPTAAHLASWAGVAPGKNESAGRNTSARTHQANRYLRSALVEAAHAVGRHRPDNYLTAQYRRLAARRGKNRAAIAVAHSIVVIAYHLIRQGSTYVDLGADYFDKLDTEAVQKRLIARLQRLGLQVTVQPHTSVA